MQTVEIHGSVEPALTKPVEMFRQEMMTASSGGQKKKIFNTSKIYGSNRMGNVDISWLPSASGPYHISANIADYVAVPVGIVTSDVPNRNTQGFSAKTLLSWDTNQKRRRYETFIGAPTHVEHVNSDCTQAKGVVLDASIVKMPEYGLLKVLTLLGFDRTKDPALVREILSSNSNSFSMGAVTSHFFCSLCGKVLGPGVTRTCTCPGDYTRMSTYGSIQKGRLHYLLAADPVFIEVSRVSDPADIAARSKKKF